nr:phosphoglycerate mutase family protein [Candidatus Laterigemmans baculatus]
MSTPHLPRLFVTRHGDTAWTESRQHTGRTDIPLNARGEERAFQLGEQLARFRSRGPPTAPTITGTRSFQAPRRDRSMATA